MKTQISLLALAAAVVAIPALAAPGGGKHNMGDANGDGVVTRAEAQDAATRMFTKMDVNKDGKLDATDRAAHMAERQDKRFAAMDTDGNGSISRAEWDAHNADRHEKRAERHKEQGDAAGKDGMRGHRGKGGHHGMANMMMKMKMADTNGDKAVSLAEFQAAAMARFDAADTNKDGKLTAEERKAAHEAMRAKHGERHAPAGK